MCSLSDGQETVSQRTQSIDDLIEPRAKSVEDYSDVLGLINLFGSHLRFGTNTQLWLKVHIYWPHIVNVRTLTNSSK